MLPTCGCPAMPPAHWNATSVLDSEPGRFVFHNPRAAWFAAVYGQLASLGVEAMGSSQFFGFDGQTGYKNDWPHPSTGPGLDSFWYYPCLSALDWTTGLPNARYHTVKLLVDQLAASVTHTIIRSLVRFGLCWSENTCDGFNRR